jgi:ABC-type branched-subunit amino acid transport system substrate-binding protein
VALNDFDEPSEAVIQAQKMAADSDLMGALGGWSAETSQMVSREYERLGLALLTPLDESKGSQAQHPGPEFKDAYMVLSGGAPPGDVAFWAYRAANQLLDVMDAAVRVEGRPSRTGVQRALGALQGR